MRLFQYQAKTEPVLAVANPPAPSADGWVADFTDPVRKNLTSLMMAALIASGGTDISFVQPTTIDVRVSSWVSPFTDPVRVKPRLQEALQSNFTAPVFVPAPPMSSWAYPLNSPVRVLPGLAANKHQFFAAPPLVIIPSMASWKYPLSEPVRVKPGLLTANQQFWAANFNPISATIRTEFFSPLSEPVRVRPQLNAADQQYFFFEPTSPEAINVAWFIPLVDPVRVKPKLLAANQQWLAYHPRILPTPNVTVVWASTEINSDVALFAINVYDSVSSATSGQGAKVSIEEVSPGNDPTSIRES